jgi:type II secretory ATPase GspE/PulE/Tfp pilus assembly ATPase PilB-like protein
MSEASRHGTVRRLEQDGWAKVGQGITSVAEVVRATQDA